MTPITLAKFLQRRNGLFDRPSPTPEDYIIQEQEGSMTEDTEREMERLIRDTVVPGYYPGILERRDTEEYQEREMHYDLLSGLSSLMYLGIGDNEEVLLDIPSIGYAMIPRDTWERAWSRWNITVFLDKIYQMGRYSLNEIQQEAQTGEEQGDKPSYGLEFYPPGSPGWEDIRAYIESNPTRFPADCRDLEDKGFTAAFRGSRDEFIFLMPNGVAGYTLDRSRMRWPGIRKIFEYAEKYLAESEKKEKKVKVENYPMRLKDAVWFLENELKTEEFPEGIAIAQDFGGHLNCSIDNNCPEAVKLRKLISDAKIDFDWMRTRWNELQSSLKKPKPLHFNLPDLSGKAKIVVSGKEIEIDLTKELEEQVSSTFRYKLEEIRRSKAEVEDVCGYMFGSYLDLLQSTMRNSVLPQVSIPVSEFIQYRCFVTKGAKNTYLIGFPITYNPQWIWTGGDRYKLHKKHIEALKRELFLIFQITKDGKFKEPYLYDLERKSKFYHYHGDSNRDCWGQLKMPDKWDGSVKQLADLSLKVMGALATINRDSLMSHEPRYLPKVPELLDKAKRVGKEDEIEPGAKEIEVDDEEPENEGSHKQWGNSH